MTEMFELNYINYLFSEKTSVTLRQMELIAEGKRTPSTLFTAEKNQLQALFLSSLSLSKSEWVDRMKKLSDLGWLTQEEGRYQITPSGQQSKEAFILNYPLLNCTLEMSDALTRKAFWHWFIFVTQILSEFSYGNKGYIPYISDRLTQNRIKKWLAEQGFPQKPLAFMWADEIKAFLETLPDELGTFIVNQMIGHNYEGMTKRQTAEKHGMTSLEVLLTTEILMDRLSLFFEESDLLKSLWDTVHKSCHYGLSDSAYRSMTFLMNGSSIHRTAAIRKLKENTVKEHVLEAVLISKYTGYKSLIPKEVYDQLRKLFLSEPSLSYAQAQQEIQQLEFFWYRLVEIERIRGCL